jgi:hypothetical protein
VLKLIETPLSVADATGPRFSEPPSPEPSTVNQ